MQDESVRVVVVDDSEDAAEMLGDLLRLYNYQVWTCASAEDALAVIEARRPHCVLFDVIMPGLGGDELCTRVRERYGDDIVLVAMSGVDEGDPRVHKSFTLADHYFTKPIEPEALTKVLRPL
jgi:DNA-binding response OmpR family regulator